MYIGNLFFSLCTSLIPHPFYALAFTRPSQELKRVDHVLAGVNMLLLRLNRSRGIQIPPRPYRLHHPHTAPPHASQTMKAPKKSAGNKTKLF